MWVWDNLFIFYIEALNKNLKIFNRISICTPKWATILGDLCRQYKHTSAYRYLLYKWYYLWNCDGSFQSDNDN